MAEERNEGRIFVRGRKLYRPRYSRTEPIIGLGIVFLLAVLAGWIAIRGAHPDPELLKSVSLERRAPDNADRGALAKVPGGGSWREASISSYDEKNLYVKIDGREGYYKSFGFVRLDCATWVKTSTGGEGGKSAEETIDLELYDLAKPANALGAAAGEMPEGASPTYRDGHLSLIDRNALYFVKGRHYLRGLASGESASSKRALQEVEARFSASLPSAPLPWSFALFLGLGIAPGKVSYLAENAFSFGFAQRVFVGLLPDGETELFAVLEKDEAAAKSLAARFDAAFREHGRALGKSAGVPWSADEWLSRASAAGSAGRWVIGVHGASDEKAGALLYARLEAVAKALSPPEGE